jgi:hypothetical protein
MNIEKSIRRIVNIHHAPSCTQYLDYRPFRRGPTPWPEDFHCLTKPAVKKDDIDDMRAGTSLLDGCRRYGQPQTTTQPVPAIKPRINDPDSDYASALVQVATAAPNAAWSRLGLVAQLGLSHFGSLCRVHSTK